MLVVPNSRMKERYKMKIHEYKYGGKTTCRHPSCPARVLLGGRCPKECPSRRECQEGVGLQWLDHCHLVRNTDGTNTFVSVVYFNPEEHVEACKEYFAFHGLSVRVEKSPFKGLENAWHIFISKA